MKGFKPIAEGGGVKLYAPVESRFAFFNSPYPAHYWGTGVDIYLEEPFAGLAPSPVEGEVVEVRRVKAPSGSGFKASSHDAVILVRNASNPETVTKILHVEPSVEPGEAVEVGDCLGVTLRSGYFGRWTSPHLHLEVRPVSSPLRVRGGVGLKRCLGIVGSPVSKVEGRVVEVCSEYAWLDPGVEAIGLVGEHGGEPLVFDGGIPYYKYFGVHGELSSGGFVELMGRRVAEVVDSYTNFHKARWVGPRLAANGYPLLGISLTLTPSMRPLFKLIPPGEGGLPLKFGDWVELSFED